MILDQVAEAICGTARANELYLSDLQAERIARSAMLATLRAIREPTEAMIDAVTAADQTPPFNDKEVRGIWLEMIDALIREAQA